MVLTKKQKHVGFSKYLRLVLSKNYTSRKTLTVRIFSFSVIQQAVPVFSTPASIISLDTAENSAEIPEIGLV